MRVIHLADRQIRLIPYDAEALIRMRAGTPARTLQDKRRLRRLVKKGLATEVGEVFFRTPDGDKVAGEAEQILKS